MDLAAAIRGSINSPIERSFTDVESALLAVVDKCEQMRAESADVPGGVRWVFADTFERVIADALHIDH